jgi:hypothetical protein
VAHVWPVSAALPVMLPVRVKVSETTGAGSGPPFPACTTTGGSSAWVVSFQSSRVTFMFG